MVDNVTTAPANGHATVDRPVEPSIASVDAPKLTPMERAQLILVVNTVRAGGVDVCVFAEYEKVTDAEPRTGHLSFPGDEDGKKHLGWITAAPTSREGNVYLRMKDLMRANGEKAWDWTSLRTEGLLKFQLRGLRPQGA